MPKARLASDGPHDDRREIHDYFELTYANWLTLPRTLLQSMPEDWQKDFVELLEKFDEEMGWAMHLLKATNVQVLNRNPERLPERVPCESCDGSGKEEDASAGGEVECMECDGDGEVETEGDEFESVEEVGERPSPIPHYQRGRTTVPLASTDLSTVLHSRMSMTREWMKANHKEAWREIYGPEFEDGEEVEIARHTFDHALPPVLDEVPHLGQFDGKVVNVVEGSNNSLYKVMAKLGPFEESGEIEVQLHADQIRKAR